jgi:hypothetical protein
MVRGVDSAVGLGVCTAPSKCRHRLRAAQPFVALSFEAQLMLDDRSV